jgi:glycosyltransferase involved in cell wall biosynthesis
LNNVHDFFKERCVIVCRVSVVIPLYNKAQYIKQAISNVLSQTIQDFEIIVVNDGSTDGGEACVEALKDSRIKLIHQENAGAGAARNRGILEAASDFIALLDADDEWESEHLGKLLSLKEDFPDAGLYYTAYRQKFANNNELIIMPRFSRGYLDYFQLGGNFKFYPQYIQTSSCALKKSILDKIGYFNNLKNAQDLDLFSRIALDYDVVFSPDGFSIYRFDRAELIMNKTAPPLADEYARRADFLSKNLLENQRALWNEFFVLRAKDYTEKKRGLLDYLWSRQIRFIALFVFWGYRREAYCHFLRTLKFYGKFPRSIYLNIISLFFLCLTVFPSRVLRFIYDLKHNE